MEQRFDTWQRGIRRAANRVFGAFCLVVALLQIRSLVAAYGDSGLVSPSAVAGVVFLLAAAGRGLVVRVDRRDAAAFTLLLGLTAADTSLLQGAAGTGGDANPTFFVLAATSLSYVVALRGLAVPAAVAGAGALYVTCSVVLGDRLLGPALDEAVLLATSNVAIWVLFRELELEARWADDAHYRTIAEQGAAARVAAEQRMTLAAQRTLHDRVLTALLLLLRVECREAAAAVRALGDTRPAAAETTDRQFHRRLAQEAAGLAGSTGVVARTRLVSAARPVPVPGVVAEAMSGAVAEAIRNVGRHARVEVAEVVLTAAPAGGLRVEVIDHGPGLPAGSAAGFGLRHSVNTRLREVGGSASIDTSADGGTRVTLAWTPEPIGRSAARGADSAAPEAELSRVSRHPRTMAAEFAVPLLVGAVYLAVRYPFAERPAWTDVAVVAGVLAYGLGCVLAVPWPSTLRRLHLAGFVALPGVLAAGLYLAGPGSLLGFDCWIVGLAGTPVLILAMARPLLPVLALALLESAVVTGAAVVDPVVSPLEVLAPITQTPMFAGLLAYGVSAVQRVRSTAVTEERAAAAALALTQAAEVRQRAIETHYAWLHSDVAPFLDGVAGGDHDPDDPAVRRRASVLALAIRDELAIPAQISRETRHLIAAARDRGTRVRVRATDEWAPEPPELALILQVLDAGDGLSEVTDITVSLPQGASTRLRVVVRPRLSPAHRAEVVARLAGGRLEIDEDDLVSIITFTPRPRSDHDQ